MFELGIKIKQIESTPTVSLKFRVTASLMHAICVFQKSSLPGLQERDEHIDSYSPVSL